MPNNEAEALENLISSGLVTDPTSARGKLLAKAAHLFNEKGYERTTVRDLAREVGIQSGSIFHHFKSKDAILRAVLEEAIHVNTALMRTALSQAQTARAKVLALIKCELEAINGTTGEAMAILVFEWRCLSADNQRELLALRDVYEMLWSDAINDAIEEGIVTGESVILRRLLAGAMNWTPMWFKPDGPISIDQLAEQILALVVKE